MPRASVHNGHAPETADQQPTPTGPTALVQLLHAARACRCTPLPEEPVGPRLLTADEAAAMLGISKRTVYELMSRGHLHSVTIGRSRRIKLTDLEQYVDSLSESA